VPFNDRFASNTIAFILAGGAGRRLDPLTRYRPKPLVPFGGCFRILDFTLSNCFNSGVDRAYVLTQHESESIDAYLRKGWSRTGAGNHEFAISQPPRSGRRYAGTADAVLQNLEILQEHGCESVLVVSADHIYKMDYRDLIAFHDSSGADLTIATVEHPSRLSSGMGVLEVDTCDRVVAFEEKPPAWRNSQKLVIPINMGVYVFNVGMLVRALKSARAPLIDIAADLIPCVLPSYRVRAYRHADRFNTPLYWRDVGTLERYYDASMDLLSGCPPLNPFDENWPVGSAGKVGVSNRNRLSTLGSETGVNSVIPSAASVQGASVYSSVLSPGVVLESGVDVRHCVLLPGAVLKRGARARGAIIDAHVVIEAGDQIGYSRQRDESRFHVLANGTVVVSPDHLNAESSDYREHARVV
jgi:glucose-1-phosphate adenylyltransferase